MDPLVFTSSAPKSFILAADPQFSEFTPENDQVWELDLEPTNIYPFQIHTTYGLQASSMRVFPILLWNKQNLLVSSETRRKIHITQYFPAILNVSISFKGYIKFQFSIFAIEPDVLVGEVAIENRAEDPLDLNLQLAAILTPLGIGLPTHPEKRTNQHILLGYSSNYWPLLFMSGGPSGISNPYPALSLPLHILGSSTARVDWALATKKSQSASLAKAQGVLSSDWHQQAARQRMNYESKIIRIKTGNPDWDAAFLLTQNCAISHLAPISELEGKPSFTRSRLPDDTPSHNTRVQKRADMTTLEAYHLAQVILPTHPEVLKTQIRTFLNRSDEDGSLNSNLQISPFLETFKEPPMLGKLCLDFYKIHQDKNFLIQTFPDICRIFDAWLPHSVKTQEDILPIWQHPQQLQIESGLFSFDVWDDWGRGINIQSVKSPSLAVMLLSEAKALEEISTELGEDYQHEKFHQLATILEETVQNFWIESRGEFCYLDYQSGRSPGREFYYPAPFQDRYDFNKTFFAPQRLICHLYANDEKTRAGRVIFKGTDKDGNMVIEDFGGRDMHWILGRAHIMTTHLFQTLESLSVEGLTHNDHILVESVDLQQTDISCLLPIWGGGINHEQIEVLLKKSLNPQDPGLRAGIPETWLSRSNLPASLPIYVNVIWNTLILEGMLQQGYISETREIFSNLMETIVAGLKNHSGFFPFYEREKDLPTGGRNAIAGLVPLHLYLKISGIKIFSPNRVAVWGSSPFPEPIEVHWQGLSLYRQGSHIRITFPNGAIYDSNTDEPKLITPEIPNKERP